MEHCALDGELSALLSLREIARAERLIKPQAQQDYRLARGLLRLVLARYVETAPQNIFFERNEHGKPYITDSPLNFNISHSRDRLLIAVSVGRELGVDIEFRKKNFDSTAIVKRWFSVEERAAIEKGSDFFDIWAKKEAYVKALGVGIYKNFHTFTVPFPRVGNMDGWSFQALEIDTDYAAALVYPAPEIPICLCGFPDLGN